MDGLIDWPSDGLTVGGKNTLTGKVINHLQINLELQFSLVKVT